MKRSIARILMLAVLAAFIGFTLNACTEESVQPVNNIGRGGHGGINDDGI